MMPTYVHAHCHFGKWHDIEVEDDVSAYLEYENGATGVFITSTGDAPGTNRFEVLGTGGKLVSENGELIYYRNEVDEREFNRTYRGGFGQPKYERIVVETDGETPACGHSEKLHQRDSRPGRALLRGKVDSVI